MAELVAGCEQGGRLHALRTRTAASRPAGRSRAAGDVTSRGIVRNAGRCSERAKAFGELGVGDRVGSDEVGRRRTDGRRRARAGSRRPRRRGGSTTSTAHRWPAFAPSPSLNASRCAPSAPPSPDSTIPVRMWSGADAGVLGRRRGRLPGDADARQEVVARRGVLAEDLVAPVAVVPDGGAGHEDLRRTSEPGERLGEQRGALDPALRARPPCARRSSGPTPRPHRRGARRRRGPPGRRRRSCRRRGPRRCRDPSHPGARAAPPGDRRPPTRPRSAVPMSPLAPVMATSMPAPSPR